MDYKLILFFVVCFGFTLVTVTPQTVTPGSTLTLHDCPEVTEEPGVKGGAVLQGSRVSCKCESTVSLETSVQWYSHENQKIGRADHVARLEIRANTPIENNFTCRNEVDNGDELHFRPQVAYGPTNADVHFRRADSQNSTSRFVICPGSENTILLNCSVSARSMWPFPLFRIHVQFAGTETIYHSTGNLTHIDGDYHYVHAFKPNTTGTVKFRCRALNSLFQEQAFGEVSLDDVVIEDQRQLHMTVNSMSTCNINGTSMTFDAGQNLTFACFSNDTSVSLLRIFNNDTEANLKVDTATDIQTTKTLQCSDTGRYGCEARNSASERLMMRSIDIGVKCPISLPSDNNVQNQTYEVISNVARIQFKAYGYPDPDFFQLSRNSGGDGWRILDVLSYSISHPRKAGTPYEMSVLLVINAENGNHDGQYRLSIGNGVAGTEPAVLWFRLRGSGGDSDRRPAGGASGSGNGVGLGIGIAAAVLIIVVGVIVFVVWKRRRDARSKAKYIDGGIDGPYAQFDNSSVSTGTTYLGSVNSRTGLTNNANSIKPTSIRSNSSMDTESSWAPSGHPFEAANNLHSVPSAPGTNFHLDEPHMYEELPEGAEITKPHPHLTQKLSKEDKEAGYIEVI